MRYAGLDENIGFHLVKVKEAAAKSGAEMAVSISGDNIKTIMHYYADPAQPNIGAVRIIDLSQPTLAAVFAFYRTYLLRGKRGSVFAIESANIVGYAQTPAIYGYKAMGSAFAPVSGGDYKIQDIKPVPPSGDAIEDWTYFIYEIGAGGAANGETYVYMLKDNGEVAADGWYNVNDTDELVNLTFKAGEAFAYDVDMSDCAMQTSGQVELGEVVTPAVYGYKAMCNPYPVTISIQDMTPVPPEGVETIEDWTYFIYEIGAGGAANGETYVYMLKDNGEVAADGWYNVNDTDTLVDIEYAAGEGFAFDVDASDCGLAFTCPITK